MDVVNKYKLEVMDLPLSLYWNVAFNLGESNTGVEADKDFAWSIGGSLGKLKNKGDWKGGLLYRHVEADSVVSSFNDSDFVGTNRRGFIFHAGYQLLDRLSLKGTLFVTENIENGAAFNTADQDFIRLQLDAIVKF